MTDIFEALCVDHRDVERLFEQYRDQAEDAVARNICEALTMHAEVEEQVLSPELRRIVEGGDDLANDAEAEHGVVRLLIARIQETPPADLRPLVEELRKNVEHHVAAEESDLFSRLPRSRSRRRGIGAEVRRGPWRIVFAQFRPGGLAPGTSSRPALGHVPPA